MRVGRIGERSDFYPGERLRSEGIEITWRELGKLSSVNCRRQVGAV